MQLTIETYLVLETTDALSDLRKDKDIWSTGVSGAKIYPIGAIMPIIRRGTGCVGIATIKKCSMTEYSTEVEFNVASCSPKTAQVYYDMYRNMITMADEDDDPYEDPEDVFIPGAMRPTPSTKSKPHPRPFKKGWD